MARRLPRPADPIRARCELDQAELKRVEDLAHGCRLSVASFIRVALIEAAEHAADRQAAWLAVADRLAAAGHAEPPKKRGPKPKAKPE